MEEQWSGRESRSSSEGERLRTIMLKAGLWPGHCSPLPYPHRLPASQPTQAQRLEMKHKPWLALNNKSAHEKARLVVWGITWEGNCLYKHLLHSQNVLCSATWAPISSLDTLCRLQQVSNSCQVGAYRMKFVICIPEWMLCQYSFSLMWIEMCVIPQQHVC